MRQRASDKQLALDIALAKKEGLMPHGENILETEHKALMLIQEVKVLQGELSKASEERNR